MAELLSLKVYTNIFNAAFSDYSKMGNFYNCVFSKITVNGNTVKILKFGTPQTIAIIVLKIEKFDVTLHKCIQKMLMEW